MAEPLVLERDGRIARLVFDRPPRNAMDGAYFRAFLSLVGHELPRLDAKGLVIHGRGRHFSAGADVDELLRRLDGDDASAFFHETTAAVRSLGRLPYPVVAAVGGCCLGSGLELALACHCRVAATNGLFGLPEAGFGLIPGCCGTVLLPRLVGRARAIELVLTGRMVAAPEALAIGLVDRLVPPDELLEAAVVAVERLSGGAQR